MMNHNDSPTSPLAFADVANPDTSGDSGDSGDSMTTTTEAARQLGYASTKGISQRIQRGRIPGAMKQGNTWLVPVAWVREQQTRETVKNKGCSSPQRPDESPAMTGDNSSAPAPDSSPVLPTPAPDLVPAAPSVSKDVDHKQEGDALIFPAQSASAPLTPMQLYVHSLARLVDRLETLRPIRQRIGNAVYERQQNHDGHYIPQPDESCSKYKCNWNGWCIFYRSKGCPSYDETTRSDYKHAVGQAFYDEHKRKLPLLEYPPCLCHPE